jgi:hypothetical protein
VACGECGEYWSAGVLECWRAGVLVPGGVMRGAQ